jgi:hypothetical protein
MTLLKDRVWSLQVDQTLWREPLQIEFTVELFASRASGKAQISVFNLSESSKQKIASGATLKLRAGYKELEGLIFSGSINERQVRVERDRVEIESIAIPAAIQDVPINLGFTEARSNRAVIQAIAQEVDVIYEAQNLTPEIEYGSWSFAGKAKLALDELAEDIDGTWWIQGGLLYVLPAGSPITGSAVKLNQSRGLIGTPARGKGIVEAQSLLNPLLLPGTQVQLESKAATGNYRLQGSTFSGNYHGPDWTVTVRLKPLEGG